jgi:hypothetical protein
VVWPGTAGVLGVQSCTSDRRLGPARVEKKERGGAVLLALDTELGFSEKLRSGYGAGVSPQTAKPRYELVPPKCACQGESKNSSVQKERRDSEICEIQNKNATADGLGG